MLLALLSERSIVMSHWCIDSVYQDIIVRFGATFTISTEKRHPFRPIPHEYRHQLSVFSSRIKHFCTCMPSLYVAQQFFFENVGGIDNGKLTLLIYMVILFMKGVRMV